MDDMTPQHVASQNKSFREATMDRIADLQHDTARLRADINELRREAMQREAMRAAYKIIGEPLPPCPAPDPGVACLNVPLNGDVTAILRSDGALVLHLAMGNRIYARRIEAEVVEVLRARMAEFYGKHK